MNIDFEEEMIVPKSILPVTPATKGISVIINHLVKNNILIKRVEALGKEAIVYHRYSNEVSNKYTTEFDIINAFFVTFTPRTPEDYLCLIGTNQIDFYALLDDMYCPLTLPFKISQAHPCNFGLILERSSLPGEFGNPPGAAQLFSLTHPYNEILPILCKFKGDSQCHYTFRNHRIGIVPKGITTNWNANYCGQTDFIMCYDYDERINHIFSIRKCTKDERMAAKDDLGVLNSSALMHTPNSVQSFYSPNFFNRRFAENRHANLNLLNAQKNQSPINHMFFANTSNYSNQRTQNNSMNTANSSNGSFLPPSKPTPITRRITRSMAIAVDKVNFSNCQEPSSTATEKTPPLHRSLERNATINRIRLKQKITGTATGAGASNIYHTPRHAASFCAVDIDDLLSFGGREEDDGPPSSLDMAVEFCLEWMWSEPIHQVEDSTRSASSSSVGTEKVATKLETLRVSSSASSHSDENVNKTEVSRMASTFFVSKIAFAKRERCIIFHIPNDRRIRVLGMYLTTDKNIPIVLNGSPSYIRGNTAIPFLHSPYYMVIDTFSFSDSFSTASLISLYTGSYKIANITFNCGMGTVLRLLPGGLCPGSHNLYEVQAFIEREDNNESDESFLSDVCIFTCQLQFGFATRLANRCLLTVCNTTISSDRRIAFLANLFCSNPWRVVAAAQQIPFIDELSTGCIELALMFEHLYKEFGYVMSDVPFYQLISRVRNKMSHDAEEIKEYKNKFEGCSASKRTRLDLTDTDLIEDDKYWNMLDSDYQIAQHSLELLDNLHPVKFINDRLLTTIKKYIYEERNIKQKKCLPIEQLKKSAIDEVHSWLTAPCWTNDLRVYNIKQMLDSLQPILIPSRTLGPSFNEMQQREQHEQFLMAVALRTVTRPFGRAALNLRTRHGFPCDNEKDNGSIGDACLLSQMGVQPICLNGRLHPGLHQVDFPLNDTNPSHKLAIDWANFYNALAHGLTYCGGFSERLYTATTKEEGLTSTMKAGLLLAAGLTGTVRNAMNLYDIHALLTQNDRHLVIALLIGCAAAHRGTSEVHIYKMIVTHLPFLLQPTLCELRIELVVQTAALISLGLLFTETANHTVSSQLLNQMALEVPCESDQSFERYSFVLTAGMAIGLINLGKGKAISDTEIPISSTPSLKDRLLKMLNGGERRLAYLNYDRVHCPGMRIGVDCGAATGSSRRYKPGGIVEGITENGNNGPSTSTSNNFFAFGAQRDYSGIGQPPSNHVRELPTLNMHLTSPAAAVALGLMYLRTKDSWIRNMLAIKDTFYEIDKIRPDMLMIRTICRCLIDFDDINCTQEWLEEQVPEIIRKYAQHYRDARRKTDLWWTEFIDVQTVAKAYLYCLTGACFALSLRYASSNEAMPLQLIHHLFDVLQLNGKNSWARLSGQAGLNCVKACTNVCAICFGLIMAGSGDLHITRLLRKIRNTLSAGPSGSYSLPNKDYNVHSLHMSVNMALGFLYLGYGRYCFANTNLAIAALVLSLFPLFPHSITDNRCYFQPIRFLWVLAVKPSHRSQQRGQSKEAPSSSLVNQEMEIDGSVTTKAASGTQQNEFVNCPRCGRIEITKNDKFTMLML